MRPPSESTMARRFTFAAALGLAGACSSTSEKEADSGWESDLAECTPGTRPEIDGLSIEEGPGTSDGPSLLVKITGSDADGDLHSYEIDLWFDDTVDGSVEVWTDNRIAPGPVNLDVVECGASAITSEIEIILLGGDVLAFDSLYEFAAVLRDAEGLSSAPAITTAQTPSER
jgi:hypothetical protein